MTLVKNLSIPPEVSELFRRAVTPNNVSAGERIDKKFVIYRKRNFSSLIARGRFHSLANLWDDLTFTEKEDWDDSGFWAGVSGWDLFVQDTLYRINNDLLAVATPSLYHQYFVGCASLNSPTGELQVFQQYLYIPFNDIDFAFNVKSSLESLGAGSFAVLRFWVETGYWDDEEDAWEVILYEYDLTDYPDWEYIQDTYSDNFYIALNITIELHIYKMSGLLYIDGMELAYDDQNHILDFQCNEVENNWQVLKKPQGSEFKSIYPPDNI